MTPDAGYDVVEVGDGHWSVHEAGTTRSVATLQKDADGYRIVDAQDVDLGTFATLEEAIARLSDER